MVVKKLLPIISLIVVPSLLGALDLRTVLDSTPMTAQVWAAEIAVAESYSRAEESRYPGDISVSAQPGISIQTPQEGPFAETVGLTGSVSVSIPVGLSDAKTAVLDDAVRAITQAERSAAYTADQAYLDLYDLYQEVWIAQEALGFLRSASTAARATFEMERLLFESGEVSLLEYAASEEALKQAEDAVVKGNLEYRLAWVELASIVGLDWREPVTLEPALAQMGMLPRPSELIEWAFSHHPDIIEQQENADAIERELEDLTVFDLSAVIRTTINAFSHSASVTYNTASPLVSASYSFPIASIGPETSSLSSASSSWSIGLSASLGVDTGKESELKRQRLLVTLEAAYQRLSAIQESLSIQIRSRYQQHLIAGDAVAAAEWAVERAQASSELAMTKYELKQLTESELDAARIQVDRAILQLNTAQVAHASTALSAAHAAAYLDIYTTREEVTHE